MRMKISLVLMMTLFSTLSIQAQSIYALAKINLGYGMLDIGAGGGSINIAVDDKNQITHIGIDALGGVLGFDEHVLAAQTLTDMVAGKSLNYVMSGADKPLFKVSAMKGFGPFGGPAKISLRDEDDVFHSQVAKVARDARTGRYHLWRNNKKVKELAINLRGYGIPVLYVGWAELN